MTEQLRAKCELFSKNRSAISKKFLFENGLMSIAAGLIFTAADREADIEKLTECRRILTKHTGFFSEYRDAVKLALLSGMALSGEPEQYIEDVKVVYKKLHKGHFRDNSYMVLAAMLICDLGRQKHADAIIEKHREIMARMNQQHPILTDSEDISYVILLALSDRSVDSVIDDMNVCFEYVKKTRRVKIGSDSVQSLSELLALTDGDTKEKCDRVIELYDTLNGKTPHADAGCVLSALGTLTDVDADAEDLVNEITEADAFLQECRGFDEKTVDRAHRLMFAILLVAGNCGTGASKISNTFISSALSMIKAKHIAAVITVVSNVLPSLLGAVADKQDGEPVGDESSKTEQETGGSDTLQQ